MTTEERLRSLLEKATPTGDWASGGDEVYAGRLATYRLICRMSGDYPDDTAALIVEAVNALPKLLAVVAAGKDVVRCHRADEYDARGESSSCRCSWHAALRAALAALDEGGNR